MARDSDWLEGLAKQFALLHRQTVLAEWRLLTGRSASGPLVWQTRVHRLLGSPSVLQKVRTLRQAEDASPRARSLEMLERLATDVAIEQHPPIARSRARLQRRIVAFRPTWKGKKVNRARIREVIRTSENRQEREAAWATMARFERSISEDLRDLARARNDRARELGFRSFPQYRLRFEGFTIEGLQALLDGMVKHCREASRLRREQFEDATGLRDFYPWDRAFAEESVLKSPARAFGPDRMTSSILAATRRWGFGGSALNFRIDQHDLPMGGISIPVDPPDDVRVIVHPSAGWEPYMILFHEVGHSVHSRCNARLPTFLKCYDYVPGSFGFVEGIGTLFEEIPRSASWVAAQPGFGSRSSEIFSWNRSVSRIAGAAHLLAEIRTELELYRNPSADLDRLKYRWERSMAAWDSFEPPSFADPFYVYSPIYTQSYAFADLFARQLVATILKDLGGPIWPNPRIGPWLVENWFRDSGCFDWVPRLKEITGNAFGSKAYNAWAREVLSQTFVT